MTEKTFTYQTSTLFYRVTGEGRTVVMIHGFGEDGAIWDQQVRFLKDHFRLIIPDLPGSGRSALIPDMSIEGMADGIHALVQHEIHGLPLPDVDLLGHSMGGYITLAYAEKYPRHLSSIGLIHSSAFADNQEKKAARSKSITFIQQNGAYEFLKTAIPGLFLGGSEGSEVSPAIQQLVEKSKAFTAEALIHYYRAMIARPDRCHVLKNFPGPVLFIIGKQDTAVPFEQIIQQVYLPSRSHIHILRNSAHMGMLEQKEETNNFILDFLS